MKREQKIFLLDGVFRGPEGAAPPDWKSGASTGDRSGALALLASRAQARPLQRLKARERPQVQKANLSYRGTGCVTRRRLTGALGKLQRCVASNSMRRRGVYITGRCWTLLRSRWLVARCTGLARIVMRLWRGMLLRFGGGGTGMRGLFCAGLAGWR